MSETREVREQGRQHVEKLAAVLKVRVRRDECQDYVIEGARGNLHWWGPSGGYLVAFFGENGNALNRALAIAKDMGATVTQQGDTECCFRLHDIPDAAKAVALRQLLSIPKAREYAPQVLEAKRQACRKAREALLPKGAFAPGSTKTVQLVS